LAYSPILITVSPREAKESPINVAAPRTVWEVEENELPGIVVIFFDVQLDIKSPVYIMATEAWPEWSKEPSGALGANKSPTMSLEGTV
jgi:hypothetical protein